MSKDNDKLHYVWEIDELCIDVRGVRTMITRNAKDALRSIVKGENTLELEGSVLELPSEALEPLADKAAAEYTIAQLLDIGQEELWLRTRSTHTMDLVPEKVAINDLLNDDVDYPLKAAIEKAGRLRCFTDEFYNDVWSLVDSKNWRPDNVESIVEAVEDEFLNGLT